MTLNPTVKAISRAYMTPRRRDTRPPGRRADASNAREWTSFAMETLGQAARGNRRAPARASPLGISAGVDLMFGGKLFNGGLVILIQRPRDDDLDQHDLVALFVGAIDAATLDAQF